jgi:PPOX class probable F420-dependent enzyme
MEEEQVLTEEQKEFFQKPNFGHLATLQADGSPHVTPVWIDSNDEHIMINTAEGRKKVKNVRRDPRVAIEVADRENPYSMLSVRGKVVDITSEGADDHIDALAKKYLGQDSYPFRVPGEQRLILKIKPTKFIAP